MGSIPIQLPDLNAGLTEIKGVVYLDQEFLVLELETALFGEFNKEQQVIKIEPGAVEEIYLDRGLFRDRICIKPKKRDLLDVVPGTHLGEVKLKIWSKYRGRAERLVDEVRTRKMK